MRTIVTSELTRRCLILAVMILSLVFVASGDKYAEPVAAAPCCESCSGAGDPADAAQICGITAWVLDPTGGPLWQIYFDDCMDDVYACYNRCVYCNSSSGPGGSCNSSSECPIGYFCASDNTCTRL